MATSGIELLSELVVRHFVSMVPPVLLRMMLIEAQNDG
jgi:hypothetical protein